MADETKTDPELLTEAEIAQRLRVSNDTVRGWREAGTGPPHIAVGPRLIRYRATAFEEWLAKRERPGGA